MTSKPEHDERMWRLRGFEAIEQEMEQRIDRYLLAHGLTDPPIAIKGAIYRKVPEGYIGFVKEVKGETA